MSVSIKSFSDEEGAKIAEDITTCIAQNAEIAEFIRIGIGWAPTAPFSCVSHMRIRHGVYFENINLFTQIEDTAEWGFAPRGVAMQEWIDGSISGKYAIQSRHVYFEDYDDALMFYLRYKG